jgi:hypothetical protein
MYTTNDEIVVVSMLGHAYTDRVEAPAAPVVAPPPPAPAKVEPEAPPAEAPPPVDTSEKQL